MSIFEGIKSSQINTVSFQRSKSTFCKQDIFLQYCGSLSGQTTRPRPVWVVNTLGANFLSTKSGLLIGPDSSVLASHWLFLDPPFWKVVFLQVQNKTDENLVSFTEKLFVFKLSPGSSATLKLKYLTIIFATFWQSFATNSHADPILEIVQMFTKTVH